MDCCMLPRLEGRDYFKNVNVELSLRLRGGLDSKVNGPVAALDVVFAIGRPFAWGPFWVAGCAWVCDKRLRKAKDAQHNGVDHANADWRINKGRLVELALDIWAFARNDLEFVLIVIGQVDGV